LRRQLVVLDNVRTLHLSCSAAWISMMMRVNLCRYVFSGLSALLLTSCTHSPLPEVFGVTMVEETTCIGQGGRIVEGPDGAFCALG